MLSSLSQQVLRDTPFANLMQKRIYNVLLIATTYDAFMLEEDGRVDEQVFNEYTALHLRYPPRFTRVSNEEEALSALSSLHFELIIIMPNLAERDVFKTAALIGGMYPDIPLVVLTSFSPEMSRRMHAADLSFIHYVFAWLGDANLLVTIIKLIEDKLNVPYDLPSVGVQTILLVEDSIRYYSSVLPQLYHIVLEQSREFSKEALNEHLKTLRMRGRPKIMLARNYEEAVDILDTYPQNILGVITDMSFMRAGTKDPLAGYRLGKYIREHLPHTPLIVQSTLAENIRYARELEAVFLTKHAKNYDRIFRKQVMSQFGFSPLSINNPNTGHKLFALHSLKDLQQRLYDIPDKTLRHHLLHNHISRFLYARAIFPPAEILKAHDAKQYDNLDEARQYIFRLIVEYRRMKNAGVIAEYQRDRFDNYSHFARIGNGSLGGKGRGLAFMARLLKQTPQSDDCPIQVHIPTTVVICTDVFNEFMEKNRLYPLALNAKSTDEEILHAFLQSSLPAKVVDDVRSLLNNGNSPIAIRSSSLLEDSHYQPFAGIYSTYMVPRSENASQTLEWVCTAIKGVYASVFFRAAKNYLAATQNLIDSERMAVVLQEVIGQWHDRIYYPTLSGVARSYSYYPVGKERAEDGIVNLAVGLGKTIVDGGRSLQFSPSRPRHIMQLASARQALQSTQPTFWAIAKPEDISLLHQPVRYMDASLLEAATLTGKDMRSFPLSDPSSALLFSTYDLLNDRLETGFRPAEGRPIATFSALLQHGVLPLAPVISQYMKIGQEAMGRPVEIEFAMQLTNTQPLRANLYLLQIRPIAGSGFYAPIDADNSGKAGTILLRSSRVLGNGNQGCVNHIVYVPPHALGPGNSESVAAFAAQVNARILQEGGSCLWIGPGRWGSSDPCLGIPTAWSDISSAAAIVEYQIPGKHIEPSQGTHFFQNITSLGVGYFTLSEQAADDPTKEAGSKEHEADSDDFLNIYWLLHQKAEQGPHDTRHITLEQPLRIDIDGKHASGIIYASDPSDPASTAKVDSPSEK